MRIAHTLDTYLKLNSDIIYDHEVVSEESGVESSARALGTGNAIVVGSNNVFSQRILHVPISERRTEFGLTHEGDWLFRDESISRYTDSESIGLIFTHPHPSDPRGLMLFMDGTDDAALERVLRLIAPRTGIAVPDWIIIGDEADSKGIGGVIGAGSVESTVVERPYLIVLQRLVLRMEMERGDVVASLKY